MYHYLIHYVLCILWQLSTFSFLTVAIHSNVIFTKYTRINVFTSNSGILINLPKIPVQHPYNY